jgi:hypothetical protein
MAGYSESRVLSREDARWIEVAVSHVHWRSLIPALRLTTQPPVQYVPGAFPRGKAWPGRDADHLPHLVPK